MAYKKVKIHKKIINMKENIMIKDRLKMKYKFNKLKHIRFKIKIG